MPQARHSHGGFLFVGKHLGQTRIGAHKIVGKDMGPLFCVWCGTARVFGPRRGPCGRHSRPLVHMTPLAGDMLFRIRTVVRAVFPLRVCGFKVGAKGHMFNIMAGTANF